MHLPKFSRSLARRLCLLACTGSVALAQNSVPAPAVFNPVAPEPAAVAERARTAALAAADHRQMMAQLHLAEPGPFSAPELDPKRPANTHRAEDRPQDWTDGVAGRTFIRSAWGNWTNYDLTIADAGPLPDPLVLKNGEPVRDAATWWKKRRPEILGDFVAEIYGRIPARTPKVTWEIAETDPKALDGTAVMRRLMGHIDNAKFPAATPSLSVTLYTPASATGPVPVMVAIGGFGGGLVGTLPPEAIAATDAVYSAAFARAEAAAAAAKAASRAPPAGLNFGPGGPNKTRELLLAKGWGYATFSPGTLQADNGAGLSLGIIGLVNEGKPRAPDDWGSLAAISWGLSRVIDYFETDKSVDAKRLGVEGHSRWGKATLVAMAFEPRWAIGYVSCSGEGGAKLHRHNFGESLDNVAGAGEYHWMAGNFLKYAGRWDALPVDQHELIALVAPRPIFVTGGTTDLWADPVGEFKACVAAGPVYRLLGKKDVGRTALPAPDEELIAGDIGFRFHEGGHTDALDWPTFLKFADKYFQPASE